MDNKIIIKDENGEEIEFFILEETKINGKHYILVTDAEDDEDGECYVMKDISQKSDVEAIYEFVEDEDEIDSLFSIFSQLIADDTQLSR